MCEYIVKKCLFCESENCIEELYPQNFNYEDINADVFSARRVTEHFHYKIVKCKNTGLIFSKEILPDDKLATLYAESKVTFGEYNDIIRIDYWRPMVQFNKLLKKGSALEIGCSSGFFLEELQLQGFKEVLGCEPSLEAKSMAHPSVKDGIHTGFFTQDTYQDNKFDLICCFQTLDHLSDPLNILQICYNKLKKGGLLYIIVHNTNGLHYKLFKEKSPIIDVEHIYLFNPKNISMLTEKVGFKTAGVFPIKNSYPLKYWFKHAPIPFKKQVLSSIKFIGIENIKIPVNFGNMGIIAIKE